MVPNASQQTSSVVRKEQTGLLVESGIPRSRGAGSLSCSVSVSNAEDVLLAIFIQEVRNRCARWQTGGIVQTPRIHADLLSTGNNSTTLQRLPTVRCKVARLRSSIMIRQVWIRSGTTQNMHCSGFLFPVVNKRAFMRIFAKDRRGVIWRLCVNDERAKTARCSSADCSAQAGTTLRNHRWGIQRELDPLFRANAAGRCCTRFDAEASLGRRALRPGTRRLWGSLSRRACWADRFLPDDWDGSECIRGRAGR